MAARNYAEEKAVEQRSKKTFSEIVGKISELVGTIVLCLIAFCSNPSETDHRDYLKKVFRQRAAAVAKANGAGEFSGLAAIMAGSDFSLDGLLQFKYHNLLLGSFAEISSPDNSENVGHTIGVFGFVFKDFEWNKDVD